MTLHQRIIAILERARIDGGWDDEVVAERIITEVGGQIPIANHRPDLSSEDADVWQLPDGGYVGLRKNAQQGFTYLPALSE